MHQKCLVEPLELSKDSETACLDMDILRLCARLLAGSLLVTSQKPAYHVGSQRRKEAETFREHRQQPCRALVPQHLPEWSKAVCRCSFSATSRVPFIMPLLSTAFSAWLMQ